jgi:hypothetical protein
VGQGTRAPALLFPEALKRTRATPVTGFAWVTRVGRVTVRRDSSHEQHPEVAWIPVACSPVPRAIG